MNTREKWNAPLLLLKTYGETAPHNTPHCRHKMYFHNQILPFSYLPCDLLNVDYQPFQIFFVKSRWEKHNNECAPMIKKCSYINTVRCLIIQRSALPDQRQNSILHSLSRVTWSWSFWTTPGRSMSPNSRLVLYLSWGYAPPSRRPSWIDLP